MAEVENRDTSGRDVVVVDNNKNSYGWLVALIVIAVLVILFFAFGGANLFNGGGAETINVETPDTINVQPTQ